VCLPPALGGKTPLEDVKTKQWRPALIEPLKSIDQLEARRIDQAGGEPFDVSILWERLGLKRWVANRRRGFSAGALS